MKSIQSPYKQLSQCLQKISLFLSPQNNIHIMQISATTKYSSLSPTYTQPNTQTTRALKANASTGRRTNVLLFSALGVSTFPWCSMARPHHTLVYFMGSSHTLWFQKITLMVYILSIPKSGSSAKRHCNFRLKI